MCIIAIDRVQNVKIAVLHEMPLEIGDFAVLNVESDEANA